MILWSIIFVYWFRVYPRRKEIWRMRDKEPKKTRLQKKWYWKYADTYESNFGSDRSNYLNSTYGLYELLKIYDVVEGKWTPDYSRFKRLNKFQKFILAYKWGALRNGCWNYIIDTAPKNTFKYNDECIINTGGYSCETWRNKTKHGEQLFIWEDEEVNGKKFFRYSYTKKARWFNVQRIAMLIFKFKWTTHYNFMIGTGGASNRDLLKSRVFNI